MNGEFTQLGPQLGWSDSHGGCTFNPLPALTPIGDCGKPAALHVLLDRNLGTLAACMEHWAYALARLPVFEWHEWGAWCNFPGSYWHYSRTRRESDSWCSLDDGTAGETRSAYVEAPKKNGKTSILAGAGVGPCPQPS